MGRRSSGQKFKKPTKLNVPPKSTTLPKKIDPKNNSPGIGETMKQGAGLGLGMGIGSSIAHMGFDKVLVTMIQVD